MKRPTSPHHTQSMPRGLSLVELIIVLAISSLMMGGALAWFGSKRSTDFYDQMRQVESSIREVQTEISSNYVPGYNKASTSPNPCNNGLNHANCIISSDEQILATGVGMETGSVSTAVDRTLVVYYFKVAPDTTVSAYSNRTIELPVGLHLGEVRTFNRTANQCTRPNYSQLLPDELADATHPDLKISTTSWSVVTFRRDPGVINRFTGPATGTLLTALSPPDTTPDPPFTGTGQPADLASLDLIPNNPGWYLNWGGDNPTGAAAANNVPSMPCAVMWKFVSDENIMVSGVSKPRFSGEIIFNLSNQTMRLQTH